MDEKNIALTKRIDVEIRGVSNKSREDAINNAFHNLRGEIAKVDNRLIIYMKPVAVYLKEEKIQKYTERFLFLFMPREKEKVDLTLRVTVECEFLNI
jgi:uncharacterized protein (TIGR03578 family)